MGTYGYISIIAMVCYAFMLLMFLAAKRNKIVNSFLVVLTGLLLWTGGSALCVRSSGRSTNSGIRFHYLESYCFRTHYYRFLFWLLAVVEEGM